jgi:hypothetical protein
MATMTYNMPSTATLDAGKAARSLDAVAAVGENPGFFGRVVAAIQASRMRRAEIEMRRVRAILEDSDPGFKDALLPFKGE